MSSTRSHAEGAGLKVLGHEKWYGGGYCGVCGDTTSIVPVAVRFWDPDDGWKVGVLCDSCGEECAARGPKEDDYASAVDQGIEHTAEGIDAAADILGEDLDCLV